MPVFWDRLSKGFSYLMLFAATVMLGWGVLGFIEYFTAWTPPVALQYATFPSGIQFIHWSLITLSGATLLLGYAMRWRFTPLAMIVIFACLATLCAVETFDFMTNESRHWDFVRECVYYVLMSIYLLRSKLMRERFGEIMIAAPS